MPLRKLVTEPKLNPADLGRESLGDLGPARQPRLGQRHRSEQASSYLLKLPKAKGLPASDLLVALNDLLGSVGVKEKKEGPLGQL